ncbi:MAG: sigma-70 family RNA polymerase sigma factor [Hyphomonadaceae bacterium]
MGQGDIRFRTELRALLPRLRRFGHALTGSADDGDDLVQDALEKALSREGQYREGTRLDSWMYKIMQNAWIDNRRANARRARVIQPMSEDIIAVSEDGRETFDEQINLRQVREMMTRLHEDERAVLSLVSIDGLTYQQAADTLDVPIGTVMSRLARARNKLLKLMEGGPPTVSKD